MKFSQAVKVLEDKALSIAAECDRRIFELDGKTQAIETREMLRRVIYDLQKLSVAVREFSRDCPKPGEQV